MSLFDTIEKMTGSKIIGKAEDKLAKKPNCKQVDGYCQYIKVNMDRIDKTIAELEIETKALVEQIQEKKGVKLSLREKSDLRKTKDKAGENLEYLYLIRDFFAILTKNASGLILKNEELMLVSEFAPYFDGVPVLEMDDDEDRDDSVLDTFKEVWQESKEAFFSSLKGSNRFDFDEYLERYSDKIEEYLMPDVDGAVEGFNRVMPEQEIPAAPVTGASAAGVPAVSSEETECPHCHARLAGNAKFCTECGNKMEAKKRAFCTECGKPITPGAKFCSSCGTKIG